MFVTFYSFKGGVGRSMALGNVAEILADAGYRVIMVDWDLEAPGLERFFCEGDEAVREVRLERGLLDLLLSYKKTLAELDPEDAGSGTDWLEHLESPLDVALPIERQRSGEGWLKLITAGRRVGDDSDQGYAHKVQAFDWTDFYDRWAGAAYFEFFRNQLDAAADFVLLDSRTGVTEQGGVCTHHLADAAVLLFAPNDANLAGTTWMAKKLSRPELREMRGGRELHVLPVPSRVEQVAEKTRLAQFRKRVQEELPPFVTPFVRDAGSFLAKVEIPYVGFYSFGERLVAQETQDEQHRELHAAYGLLAKAIVHVGSQAYAIEPLVETFELGSSGIDLEKILADHAEWLDSDEKRGARAVLRGANLFQHTLANARLDRADLSQANLIGGDLSRAELSGANLIGAKLELATLNGAILVEANLSNTNSRNTNFTKANLTRADLRGARLRGAQLVSADLTQADLTQTDLENAALANSILEEATLVEAKLGSAMLQEARASRANLTKADLTRAGLRDTGLVEAILTGASLEQADLEGTKLDGAKLDRCSLRDAYLKATSLRNVDLRGAQLQSAHLREVNLDGTSLVEADLTDAVFRESSLRSTDFTDAILSRTDLRGANLRQSAGLTQLQLRDAETSGAQLPKELAIPAKYRYRVFVSSSNRDEHVASDIAEALLTISPQLSSDAVFVAKDLPPDTDGEGWAADALAESEFLLVVGSESAWESPWVNQEIESWLQTRGRERILPVLTSGELDGIPAPLRELPFIDLREERKRTVESPSFLSKMATLAAALEGTPAAAVVERYEARRRAAAKATRVASTVLTILFAAFLGFSAGTTIQKEATQRKEAQTLALQSEAAEDPELSLLLAVEATKLSVGDASKPTDSALQKALSRCHGIPLAVPATNVFSEPLFSADGTWLAVNGTHEVRLWQAADPGDPVTLPHVRPESQGRFGTDGRTWVEWNAQDVAIWSASDGSWNKELTFSLPGNVDSAWATPNRIVAVSKRGGTPSVCLVWTREAKPVRLGDLGEGAPVVVSGSNLVLAGDLLWDISRGKPERIELPARPLSLSPGGEWSVVRKEGSPLRLCDMDTRELRELTVEAHMWLPKSRFLNRSWLVLDQATYTDLLDLRGKAARPVARGLPGYVLGVVPGSQGGPSHALLPPSAAKRDGPIQARSLDGEETVHLLTGIQGRPYPRTQLTQGGRYLAVLDQSRVRLVDMARCPELITHVRLGGKSYGFMSAEPLDSGGWQLIGFENGERKITPIDRSELLKLAAQLVGRNLTPGEWNRYFPGQPYRKTFPELD